MTHVISPQDPRLSWQGAVSLAHTEVGTAAWRIPFAQRNLFPPERLQERAAMPAGVRLTFRSDARKLGGRFTCAEPDPAPLDVVIDGQKLITLPLAGRDTFQVDDLPPGAKEIELWLPQFGQFALQELWLNDGADLRMAAEDTRPKWVVYGSSITQCRQAESPTQTWPAIVARRHQLNLTCLGFGGECQLDLMIGRMIRDLPADLITLSLGINIQHGSHMSLRIFRPSIIGFVQLIREKHPTIPITLMSPIYAPVAETIPNALGYDLRRARAEVHAAAETLLAAGDPNLHYIDGLHIFGPTYGHLLPDDLHPNAEGYKVYGANFARRLGEIMG